MELSREEPPRYVAHDPDQIKLPSVPTQEIRIRQSPSELTLPNLQSVLAGLPERPDYAASVQSHHSRHSNEFPPLRPESRSFRRPSQADTQASFGANAEAAVISPSDTGSVMSCEGHGRRSTSIVSLEDPDVRLAAEALSGLGNPGEYISRRTSAFLN